MTKWYNIMGAEELRIHLRSYIRHLERQDSRLYGSKIKELKKILANLENFSENDWKPFYRTEEQKIKEALLWNKNALEKRKQEIEKQLEQTPGNDRQGLEKGIRELCQHIALLNDVLDLMKI